MSLACLIVEVRVANPGDFSSSALEASHWTVIDVSGTSWHDPFVEDDRRLAAGEERVTKLGFTVPAGTDLVRLDWTASSGTISLPLPGA